MYISIVIAGHNRFSNIYISIAIAVTIDYEMHPSIAIAGNNRSRSVFIDSHSLSASIDSANYPSIAIVGDDSFQLRYLSTLLPGQYGGDVTYR